MEIEAKVQAMREAIEGGASNSDLVQMLAELRADEIDRLLAAIVRADLQIGDGHIEQARRTLHSAMDKRHYNVVP
jgi:cellobiose-specific phosphotransferase system component IIA